MIFLRLLLVCCLAVGTPHAFAQNATHNQQLQRKADKPSTPSPKSSGGGSSSTGSPNSGKTPSGGGGSQPNQALPPKATQPLQTQPKQAQPAPSQKQPETKQHQSSRQDSAPQSKQKDGGAGAPKGAPGQQGKDQPSTRQTETRDRYIPERREKNRQEDRTQQAASDRSHAQTDRQTRSPSDSQNNSAVSTERNRSSSNANPPKPQSASQARTYADVLSSDRERKWLQSLNTSQQSLLSSISPNEIIAAKNAGKWDELKAVIDKGAAGNSINREARRPGNSVSALKSSQEGSAHRNHSDDVAARTGSTASESGKGQSTTSQSGATSRTYADVLTSDERRWLASLDTDQRARLNKVSPDQIAAAKQAGKWNDLRALISQSATSGPHAHANKDASEANPPSINARNSERSGSQGRAPTASELAKLNLTELAKLPQDQLVNLPADRRSTLERYVTAASAPRETWSTADSVKAFSRSFADGLRGAGTGALESVKNTSDAIAKVVTDPRGVAQDTIAAMDAVARDPVLAATEVGRVATQSAADLSSAVKAGDANAAGRITGKFFGGVVQSVVAETAVARVSSRLATLGTAAKGSPSPPDATKPEPRIVPLSSATSRDTSSVVVQPFLVVRSTEIRSYDRAAARARFGEPEHEHHIFTNDKELRDRWPQLGINREDYVMLIPESLHNRAPAGVHSRALGPSWNDEWKAFFRARPNASRDQVFEQANKMVNEFGLLP